MGFSGKNVAVFVIVSLIVGALLGARLHPTSGRHIRLEIENGTNRVVLVPKKGDVINWYTQPTSSQPPKEAYVKFQQWSPCDEGLASTSKCTVKDDGYFEYKCDTPTCRDPAVDPRSVTSAQAQPGVQPEGKGSGSGSTGTPPPGPDPLSVPIGCDNKTQNPQPNLDPLSVVQTQVISWTAGTITNFTITIPSGFCKESASGSIAADPNAVCTVQASAGTTVTYNVKGVCTNNAGSFTVSVH